MIGWRAVILTGLLWLAGCATLGQKGGTLVPLAPVGTTEPAARPRRYALLIGIDRFEDARFSPLRYAEADARALAQALEGFDDVTLLVGAQRTTRAALLEALAALVRKASAPRDTVLIYVSGHGSLGQRPGQPLARYLVASDSRLDLMAETGLSIDELIRTVGGMRARRAALVLATCHSGTGKSHLPDALVRELSQHKAAPPPLAERSEAVLVATAAAFGEVARESDDLRHDVYTHYLLEGLRLGDRDGDGAVTITEAHDHARERTYVHTGGAQRPTLESSVVGLDPIVLRGTQKRSARPVVYSYARSAEGLRIDVNGAKSGTLPGSVALDAGRQRLALVDARSGAVLHRGVYSFRSGQRIDLTELIPLRPRLEVGLAAASLVFVSAALRQDLPAVFGAAGRVGVRGWPVQEMALTVGLGLFGGTGALTAFGATVPFTLRIEQLDARVSHGFKLGRRVELRPGLLLGGLWAQRLFSLDTYRGQQALAGGVLGGELRLSFAALRTLDLGLRLDGGGLWARIDGSLGPHAFVGIGLEGVGTVLRK